MATRSDFRFILVRHGEATHNAAYHERGVSVFEEDQYKDAPLTEKGVEQARELATKLAEKYAGKTVSIWTSPLTRAIQTAEELFEEMDSTMTLYAHDGFLEFQDFKNKANHRSMRKEIKERFPHVDLRLIPEIPAFWVETEPSVLIRNRMRAALLTICELVSTPLIVIVSHAHAIQALIGEKLDNCDFIEKTFDQLFGEEE